MAVCCLRTSSTGPTRDWGSARACRECCSEYNRKRYASNPDKFKSDVKKYRHENPENVLETRLKTNASNPTKLNAQKCVEAALAAGAIKKPDVCYGCGRPVSEARVEAHHHDYSRPLDIVWVCPYCHSRMDDARRLAESSADFDAVRVRQNQNHDLARRALRFYRDNCPHIRRQTVERINELVGSQ